jgi:predicted RNase H-like nuclease (RuvC/YqgF family)
VTDRRTNQKLSALSPAANASTKRYAALRSQISRLADLLEEAENLAAFTARPTSIKDRLTRARNRASAATALARFVDERNLATTGAALALRLANERIERLMRRLDRLDAAAGIIATPLPSWLPVAVEHSPRLR